MKTGNAIFSCASNLGSIEFEVLNPTRDAEFIHGWISKPYAKFWMMGGYSKIQVAEFYKKHWSEPGNGAYVGWMQGKPAFIIEVYDPGLNELAEHYESAAGDIGMHILLAPNESPVAGFSSVAFYAVLKFLFADPKVHRVVVEPDVRNEKIHRLNRRFGFQHTGPVDLKEKTALLGVCTRENFQIACDNPSREPVQRIAASPIGLQAWDKVNRLLVRKCLAELLHERVLKAEVVAEGADNVAIFHLSSADGTVDYVFAGETLPLDHYLIDLNSIRRRVDGLDAPLDALAFTSEFYPQMGIPEEKLSVYLEEISATLYSSLNKHKPGYLSAEQLCSADFQVLEAAMTEGHPAFIANNGRIGFDAEDFRKFAPETGASMRLVWIAARRSRAIFSVSATSSYESLLASEFDPSALQDFRQQLRALDLCIDDYWLLPVHPWQWTNKLVQMFAADIARQDIVYLGESSDCYQPQQSIRTFFNRSQPARHYVKTALSVLNMGFMRGLSAAYMQVTPAINDWLYQLVESDDALRQSGFRVLRELAAVGYNSPEYARLPDNKNPYRKLLAGLWRESPVSRIEEGQQLSTMAALLHIDPEGDSLVRCWIEASGLSTQAWLERYLNAYLTPLLHCLYAYRLVFMPHGENVILVLEDHVPVSIFMKDIGEEICLLNSERELPEQVARISVQVPEGHIPLSIFTDVFDCFFRYLSGILYEHCAFSPDDFWRCVARCIQRYQAQHPEYSALYAQYDLFAPRFAHSCLNRLQLRDNQQMIDLTDPSKLLQFAGELENPIYPFREVTRTELASEIEQAV
ncbi:hypothetical protein Mag101_00920 [Microbulbifer agarilyticus]|uniref:Acyltransferase MbtK/IucB-like conserved domain-containing protein n=1 Tax=Microbulbifer agarilyticus TaxID=260552 RepID=A0A1Q2M141_9GAMM|nr:GNAT family N-acetyltransferase [Microbulbifer agarilyticus]AQQ66369.1 hypothetical protein Mag101_00920 [Microbulbifer agarilyticus]